MNLPLNRLGEMLRKHFPESNTGLVKAKVYEVVYADDFIISVPSKEVLEEQASSRVNNFLKVRGLTLSREKT